MRHGVRLLRQWFDRSGRQKQALAAELEISKGYLSQILNGNRRPKLELMLAIQTATGVPIESWVDTPRGKADRLRKRSAKSTNVHTQKTEVRVG